MKKPFVDTFLLGILLLAAPLLNAQRMSNQEYVDTYKDVAMQKMKEHKIPASITLAQGILESGSGNSRLAVQGNNHFGIKCKKNWTGRTIIEDDDEKNECFRAYSNAYESYNDHSLFLKENPRYGFLFDLPILDYKAWAEGLRKAGYATNQRYPQLLIGIIERLNLAKFDTLAFYGQTEQPKFDNTPFKPTVQIVDNGIPLTVARPGQDVRAVASENNMRDWQIYKYNDLPKGSRIEPGMVIYLKPKRNKAAVPAHTVSEGESMWEISQKYGIKLKKLYKKNKMQAGTEVKPGETLSMRRKSRVMPDTGKVIVQAKPVETITDNTPVKPVVKPEVVFSPDNVVPTHYPSTTEIPETPVIASNNGNANYHIVASGETLYSISRTLNVSIDSLAKWNNLTDYSLKVGQSLIYYPQTAVKAAAKKIEHTVKAGETLFAIARMYGVSVTEITEWNKLPNNEIRVGQVLEVEDRR